MPSTVPIQVLRSPPAGGNQCTVSEHAFRLTAKFFTGGGGGGEGERGKRGGKNNFKGGRL